MTTPFTASDGRAIEAAPNGELLIAEPSGHVSRGVKREHTQALREYFQHERDQELGRWRDPENPDMVVYRVPESDDMDGRAVRVIDEATGAYIPLWERDVTYFERGSMYATAARYFAAHPETKPWHDAKPGEAWVITINDLPQHAAIVDYAEGFVTQGNTYSPFSPRITHATRIWPEESDDDR